MFNVQYHNIELMNKRQFMNVDNCLQLFAGFIHSFAQLACKSMGMAGSGATLLALNNGNINTLILRVLAQSMHCICSD